MRILVAFEEDYRAFRDTIANALRLLRPGDEVEAAYLNYPKATFDGRTARGEVPPHKRGAGWRYKREELDERLLTG